MPIVQDGFRTYTVTDEQDLIQEQLKYFDLLSPEEKNYAIEIMSSLNRSGGHDWIYYASMEEYERYPVSMDEFLTNSDYLGEVGRSIYAPWKKDLTELFGSRSYTNAIFLGSLGCLRESSLIKTINGDKAIGEIKSPQIYRSWDQSKNSFVWNQGTAPYPKGKDYLYRVITEHEEFFASAHHQIFCSDYKYRQVQELDSRVDALFFEKSKDLLSPLSSNLEPCHREFLKDDHRWYQKASNLMENCLKYFHQCDQQLLLASGSGQSFVPSRIGALVSDLSFFQEGTWQKDVRMEQELKRIHRDQRSFLLSKKGFVRLRSIPFLSEVISCVFDTSSQIAARLRDAPLCMQKRSDHSTFLLSSLFGLQLNAGPFLSVEKDESVRSVRCILRQLCCHIQQALQFLTFGLNHRIEKEVIEFSRQSSFPYKSSRIIKVEKQATKEWYWDLQVPGTNNYVHDGGFVSHNSGKSTISTICILRMLYDASCLKEPALTYGLAPGSNITLAVLAPNERVARETVFEQMFSMMRQSPYFTDVFPPLNRVKERFKSNGLQFRKNLNLIAGSSTDSSILGKNLIGAFIDELNFFQKEALSRRQHTRGNKYGADTKAGNLYDKIMRRMKSRFLKNGKMPGMLIAATSKGTQESIAERIITEAFKKQDTNYFIRDRSVIDLKKDQFSDKKFKVLVGNEKYRSRILEDKEYETTEWEEDARFIDIPEDLKPDFEADIDQSLRDLAGISTVAMSTFFKDPQKIRDCIDDKRVHPFVCASNVNVKEWDSYRPYTMNWSELAVRDGDGVWKPKNYPHVRRHVHLDPGLTNDAFAIAIGCIAGLIKSERHVDNETYVDFHPMFHIDFMLRIVGKPGMEVNFQNVRNFLYTFCDHGFSFGLISTDTFQSRENCQALEAKGFETKVLSVDESRDPYEYFKGAINNKRVSYYRHEHFLDEIVRLEDNGLKIDHLPGRSKDICDAIAGVVFTLGQTEYWNEPLIIERGIDVEKERKKTDPDIIASLGLSNLAPGEEAPKEMTKFYKKKPKSLPPTYNKDKKLVTNNAIDILIDMG